MTEKEYLERAEALLRTVEQQCDKLSDADQLDCDVRRVGNTLTLEFSSGSQVIISLQKPLMEVWLASRSGGYHFRNHEESWVNTREDGPDFYSQLGKDVASLCGRQIDFRPMD